MELVWNNLRRHPWPYAMWAVLLVLVGSYQAYLTVDVWMTLFESDQMVQSVMTETVEKEVFTAGAKEAGLRDGDRVVAVNGRPYEGPRYLGFVLRQARPNDQVTLTYQRGEEIRTATITLKAQQAPAAGSIGATVLLGVAIPWFCFVLGFGVVALRPWDRLAWLLLALLVCFSNSFIQTEFSRWPAGLADLGLLLLVFARFSWSAWFLLFGLYFPERSTIDGWLPWMKWVLLAPLAAGFLVEAPMTLFLLDHIDWARRLYPLAKPFEVMVFVSVGAISLGFAALALKARRGSTADVRRKAKLLYYGAFASMTPLLFLIIYQLLGGKLGWPQSPQWLNLTVLASLSCLPLMLGYLVVVHRALDVRIIVRQGLQHALALRGVRTLQVGLVMAVVWGTIRFSTSVTSDWLRILVIVGSVLTVISLRRIADRLRLWADRRFFRDAYNSEQLLSELGNQLRTMVETEPLLETVARRVADSLHIEKVALVLRKNGNYRPAYALGYDGETNWEFTAESPVVERLRATRRPVTVYFDDPESWINRAREGEKAERDRLQAMGSQVLLPMNVQDRLVGFVSLGPKRSEEPYSSRDLRMLESVAGQTALALENSRLTAAVAAEVAQRERLNRELEIARDVQQRLLPQKLPVVEGLDYAGHCRPAQSVGGDYYDFLLTPEGRLAMAIGDVSGKGIPASLLMASLQASLRGLVISGGAEPAKLIENMNRLIYEASPRNVFATFFFAVYDSRQRTLVYVNAGHNAPLLFRCGAPPMRLNPTGVALGLTGKSQYRQFEIVLEPGDVLLAYTDGVTEAMNAVQEEFGEERLEAAVAGALHDRAPQLIVKVNEAVDRFVAGAPQHDDLTVVVARV